MLVTGTFNIVHAGHVELLEYAYQFGRVIVGINDDEYQRAKYGHLAVKARDRAYVLRANRFVSDVVFFSESHPGDLIRLIRPAFYIKGPDYLDKEIPEMNACIECDVQILYCPKNKIYNGSELKYCLE